MVKMRSLLQSSVTSATASSASTTNITVDTAHLLVVEDDTSIRETVKEALIVEGFEVSACGDGREALAILTGPQADSVDALVLDLMLPGLGGLDLCRELRKLNNSTPILVISARDSETDRVLGLEVGADDYLVKPFGLRELVARCRALLRRSQRITPETTDTDDVIEHANLCLYCQECRVTRDGKDLSLAPKEYKILELLMRNPRRVWSRDQLLGEIWGIDFVGDTKTVDVHIRWLREKIETTPSSPDHIRTVRGFGYRFG